ncbi:MAG TPA: hypothetical protein VD866_06370 [Urbifossiella sp.]|nr:hypothetical protein [Urbifossiella sp.]
MANNLNQHWQQYYESLVAEYEAARDVLARDLARYSPGCLPPEGLVAAGLFVIGGIVGTIATDDEEDYAEEAVGSILDGYSDPGRLRSASVEVYFRELLDELFDTKVTPLRKALDPGHYAPMHDTAGIPSPLKGVTP